MKIYKVYAELLPMTKDKVVEELTELDVAKEINMIANGNSEFAQKIMDYYQTHDYIENDYYIIKKCTDVPKREFCYGNMNFLILKEM